MQHQGSQHPLHGATDLQQLLNAARQGGLQQNRSAFSSVPGTGIIPEFNLYSQFQLAAALANTGNPQMDPLAHLQQLQQLQQQGAAALLGTPHAVPESSTTTSRNSQGRGNSQSRGNSNYASRHQAAEQRRRTRINDRLERLREVVPHTERANTATFLEEVIKYVEVLQGRVTKLETAQGLPLTCPQRQMQASAPLQPPSQPAYGPPTSLHACIPPTKSVPGTAALISAIPASSANAVGATGSSIHMQRRPETPPQTHAGEGTEEDAAAAADGKEAFPSAMCKPSNAKKQRLMEQPGQP